MVDSYLVRDRFFILVDEEESEAVRNRDDMDNRDGSDLSAQCALFLFCGLKR